MTRTHGTLGRLLASACAVALGAACSTLPQARIEIAEGRRSFIAMVPDSVDDVGLAPSVTIDADGVPYISYFGFMATPGPGEIPTSRPIGSPYLDTEEGENAGAVLLTSLTPDSQVWNRGAVAQPREAPAGVTVPFGPAAEPSLASLTPSNAEGTDVAADGSAVHVTWAADTGLWYGTGPDGFEVEAVERGAGIGAPSIAVGDDGEPLIAYTAAGVQPEVRVAELSGERWTTTVVATLSQCGRDCPPATSIEVVGGEPIVVVADPASRDLIAARRQGAGWSTEVIATGVVGGASLAAAGDGAVVAYYTPGGVAVATGETGGWSVEEVAQVTERREPSPTPSPSPTGGSPSPAEAESPSPAAEEPIATDPTTGVALDGEGTPWVAWEDGAGIHLASGAEDGGFEEREVTGGAGGVTPSVAVTEDGSAVYVAWFGPLSADLYVGISAELDGVEIAAPSPAAPPPTGGEGVEDCGEDGETQLTVTAPAIAFEPTCLVAPAGERFTITFNNDDTQNAHNVAVLTEQEGEEIAATDIETGPYTDELQVSPQEEGELFFLCQAHPDQMTGTLAVVAAGAGGGGQGDGGGGNQGGGGGGNGGGGDEG